MKVYNNNYFVNKTGCYVNEIEINEGYILAKAKSPHTINKEKDISGWFPNIILAIPIGDESVKLSGSKILANNPCKAYKFQFTLYENENTIFKLPKAFNKGLRIFEDVYVNFYDLTGKIDVNRNNSNYCGGFGYDAIHNRESIIHCYNITELNLFFNWLIMSPVNVSYDLEYSAPCCAVPKKNGKIEPIETIIVNKNLLKTIKEFFIK